MIMNMSIIIMMMRTNAATTSITTMMMTMRTNAVTTSITTMMMTMRTNAATTSTIIMTTSMSITMTTVRTAHAAATTMTTIIITMRMRCLQAGAKETAKKFTTDEIKEKLHALEDGSYGMILRAKGMVPAEDGTWIYFDYVPGESDIRSGAAQVTGKLCVIGSKIDEDKLADLFLK